MATVLDSEVLDVTRDSATKSASALNASLLFIHMKTCCALVFLKNVKTKITSVCIKIKLIL